PIQNVGAYGQEVSGTVTAVRALDRESGQVLTLTPAECGFGYRDSVFKRRFPGRHVVLAVTYRLTPGGAPSLGYADLTRDLERRGIARPGFRRGQREGPVGLSTRHTLAIVCHDGARARDVVAFARTVRAGVERRFGVRLHPEPVFWGPLGVD